MKGYVREVVVPTFQAVMQAGVPLSLAWLAYQVRPRYQIDTEDQKRAAQAAHAEIGAAVSATLLSVLGLGASMEFALRRLGA